MNNKNNRHFKRVLFFMICSFLAFSTFAQGVQKKDFSLKYENVPLKTVLDKISKESDFKFMYTDEINVNAIKVSIHCTNETISSVCSKLFKPVNLNYTIKGDHIIIAVEKYGENAAMGVKGKVTDGGIPVAFASVMVPDTKVWAITNDLGEYAITVPHGSNTLVVSLIGMKTQEVAINGRNVIDVALVPDNVLLDELVVVGYGTQRKKDVTSSISKIKGTDIAEKASASFIQQMAGRASGVQVTTAGLIGATPRVIIRGVNSISSGTSPLYVINGVPVTSGGLGGSYTNNNAMGDINPSDIESFEVLKDGAATAIYGSRAANGVVLITTKQGKQGSLKVTYDGWVAAAKATQLYDVLDAEQFVEIANEKFTNMGGEPKAFMDQNNTNTNWVKSIYRTALQHSHTVSITGGTEKTTYYSSIGYTNQEGIMKDNSFSRFSFYGQMDQKLLKDVVNIGFSLNASNQTNFSPKKGVSLFSDNIYASTKLLPNVPIYDSGNPTGYNIDPVYVKRLGRGANKIPIDADFPNIMWVLEHNFNKNMSWRLLPTAYIDIKPIKGLNNRFLLSADASIVQNRFNQNPAHGDGAGRGGLVNETWYKRQRWTLQDILSYSKSFGNHNLDLTGVAEWTGYTSESMGAEVTNLSDAYYSDQIISDTFANSDVNGSFTQNGLASYIFRANYNYNGTYYIGGSVRYDGLSKLSKENRWGVFYGVSGAFRMSNLKFWKEGKLGEIMPDFRIRGSYAQVGNDDIGNFPYTDTFGPEMYGPDSAFGYTQVGNKDLKWEKQDILDLGFDISLLGRVNLSFAYWQKNNSDIVLSVPTPPSLGVPGNSISQNYGDITNHGIELELSGHIIDHKNFSWKSSFNISTQKSNVKRLISDIISGNGFLLLREGLPMYSVYTQNYAGVNRANGNPMYYKKDGSIIQCNPMNGKYYVYNPENPTEMSTINNIKDEDKTIQGGSIPKWFGGFDNTFTYKNWDLNLFFRFSGGNKIVNYQRLNMLSMGFYNNGTEILGRWQSPEKPGDGQTPRIYYDKGAVNYTNSSRWVEKGDFLKLQNLQIGYSLPKSICNKMMLEKVKMYLQAQNLWTITGYSGLDPESYTTAMGIDRSGEPQQLQILFGVSIGF
ncbi:MAG: SusC/RagA family TonB-linked outer membrane protein [Bacteroidales bacterium]